jgi:prepilin-type N-terminal cleavage/methylation domain-containing protein
MQNRNSGQQGFTIMEIVVATTIFATVVTIMMVLFNYTLQINRRVDALRQSAQGTRNFIEFLVREIRNGKIDYVTTYNDCQPDYFSNDNNAIAIVNRAGEQECFFASGNNIFIEKGGITTQINPINLTINQATFRFLVRPSSDPHPADPPFPGIQPFVTIMAEFTTTVPGVDKPVVIPYQTVVSPDIYDIPHFQ